MTQPTIHALHYDPSVEHPEDDEQETARQLTETLRGICETTFKNGGHAIRAVHAKSHALLSGEMTVLGDLPQELAQGIFAKPGRHPVALRFSTTPGDLLDDNVSTPRGVALKIIGVEGARLPGSENATTQDFLMVNGPAFAAPTAKAFLKNLKLLASTTDKAPGAKIVFSTALQAVEKVIEAFGGKSSTVVSLGGHPETHILGETFFTQAPMLYGPYMAKLSLMPVSPDLADLKGKPVDLRGHPDGLREAVNDFLDIYDAEWELRAQLCVDLEKMPIEDASVEWPEDLSPFISVARIVVKSQTGWSPAQSVKMDDGMAFSPWHGVEAHRPLGSIMRVRKMAYEMSAKFRSERNARKVEEPTKRDAMTV